MKKLHLFLLFFYAAVLAAHAQVMLIPRNSSWKYQNTGTDLGSSWALPGYDDSSWSGPAPGPLGDNLDSGVQSATSVITIGDAVGKYPIVYFRKSFNASAVNTFQALTLRVQRDDNVVVFLNGTKVLNDGVPEPLTFNFTGGTAAGGADETRYWEYTLPTTALVNGNNVIAVANYQQGSGSSDLLFDLELEGAVDNIPPQVAATEPAMNSSVLTLDHITVTFDSDVTGVNASDLLINSLAATNMVVLNPREYTFYFPTPPTGTVQVAWAANTGIADTAPAPNAFAGGGWTYNFDTNVATIGQIIISEFMADNANGIRDEDGNRSDWIELLNVGATQAGLNGWFLTDESTNLTKWQFPTGMAPLGANNYLLVWASAKNKTNALAPLHTSFKLGKEGGFLALVDPGTNIVSVFNPYPPQTANVSYGRDRVDPALTGYFTNATPRAQNSTTGSGFAPEPVFSVESGIFTNASISLVITSSVGTIRYTRDGSLPGTNSTLYTGPLTITTNVTIRARVFPADGTSIFPSAVVAKNYLFLDNTTADFNSNLPLMIISTEGRAILGEIPSGGARTKGSMTIINTQGVRSSLQGARDFQVLGAFEFFGQTSIGFAKKPIRVETQDALGNDLKVSILGMPADSDYKIRNPYDDKSMLNDYLSAEVFERMGHYSLRRRFVEAFVDMGGGRLNYAADYYGIMVILENIKIDKDRVDIAQIPNTATTEPAISGGYIFKKDKDSAGDLNFATSGGNGFSGQGLKFHEPKPNDLRVTPVTGALTEAGTNQVNFLRNYLNRMEQAMYAPNWLALTGTNHYSYYLDQDSFVDFHWLVEFTKQIDGYRISDYFHKDRGGKVTAGPVWDWNLAFGNANYLLGGQTNGWYYEQLGDGDHIWLRRLITGTSSGSTSSGDPDFTQKIADRWSVLRTNIFNGTNVLTRIDELAAYLNEAANRDLAKYATLGIYLWPNPDLGIATAGSSGTADGRDVDYVRPKAYNDNTTNSIIFQMKRYMLGRYLWIDSQFVRPPTLSASDGQVTNGFQVTITPAPGASVIYTLDGTDPRLSGGGISPQAISNNAPVTITINANVRIVARSTRGDAWKNAWSGPAAVSLYTTIPALRITEIMYHPTPPAIGSTNSASDFEYIEVKNIGATPLNLRGFTLAGGVQFQFPTNVTLAAGQTGVIVADTNAFVARYGTGITILGVFTGSLNNAGDQLVLSGPLQESVLNFPYSDEWYPATDGLGFSLVAVDESAPTSAWANASNWRPSTAVGGSPGTVDPAPPARPVILVNEVLSNEDLPSGDAVELYNPSASAVSISGWFLTDDFNSPKKYTFPFGTTVPARGYLVVYATNSFGVNGTNSFELSARGEEVYLLSGDGVNLTGYAHGFGFDAAEKNVTFGQYVNSIGEKDAVALAGSTLGATNAAPAVGPVAITEIHYHPLDIGTNGVGYNDTDGEFIELQNISGTPVALYDTTFTTNRWHLRNAVDFDFATNIVLQPGGYVLVVGFDPGNPGALNSFRQKHGVNPGVPIVGPWIGSLNNAGETIELRKPGVPDTNGTPYILVERIRYRNLAPWPASADGFGLSLQRLAPAAFGNEPTNWAASAPTPAGSYIGGTPPVVTSQPGDRLGIYGTDLTLSATASGSAPVRFQWRFNGVNLTGATNSVLLITNLQPTQVGVYNILVYNGGGYAFGTNFNISGRIGLRITSQPVSRVAQTNTPASFAVGAVGAGSVRYQWRFNGSDIPNATNATYSINTVQLTNGGTYSCLLADDYDTLLSDSAVLTLVFRPSMTVQPVGVFAVEGQSAVFSAAATGTLPMTFRWRTNSTFFTNSIISSTPSNSYLIITNVPLKYSNYTVSVIVTNIAGQVATASILTVRLFVLPDRDQDGLPDQWEIDHGFNPDSPADASIDTDGDGMSNVAEYVAGTDYLNAQSYLKSTLVRSNLAVIQFQAITNRTYSVLYQDALGSGQWEKLSDILASTNNHTEVIMDTGSTGNRFYRLVTPSRRP